MRYDFLLLKRRFAARIEPPEMKRIELIGSGTAFTVNDVVGERVIVFLVNKSVIVASPLTVHSPGWTMLDQLGEVNQNSACCRPFTLTV